VRAKHWLAVVGVGLLGAAAGGWLCRDGLTARYYVHQLLRAADADCPDWVGQAGSWGGGVPDLLVDCLAKDDAPACCRAAAALAHLTSDWPAGDPRPAALARQLAERFGRFSGEGQQAALNCGATLAERGEADVTAACAVLVRAGLHSTDTATRLRAAVLALRPQVGLAELLVPLLNDPDAALRRAALLAVGPSRDLIADDDLLRWLHDPDQDARRLCETALRSRGLRTADLRLGRLLTDPRPSARLELLALLRDDPEVDLGVWLRRLSQDESAAVRAAAARLAGEQQVVAMADRLAQMSQSDPDLTVRPIAGYHLRQLQVVRPVGATEP
jgi:hypothetical protein